MITSDDLYTEEDNDLERIEDEPTETPENDDAPQSSEEAETAGATVVKPKRVIRNPQPKLNEETLRGKRGLTTLESYFENIKYKGKGFEEQDLSTILKTYEYWCHRLFPKYPFDACIAKIEHLGLKKKAVKTFIKKIRLGMIDDNDAGPVGDIALVDSDAEDNNLTLHMNEEDNHGRENFDQFDELLHTTNTRPDSPVQESTSASVEITEELEERIRRNRERAQKLRQERLRKAKEVEESASRDVATSQISTQHHSDEEMDVDSIFDQIQHSNQQENGISTTSNISQKNGLSQDANMTSQTQFSDDED